NKQLSVKIFELTSYLNLYHTHHVLRIRTKQKAQILYYSLILFAALLSLTQNITFPGISSRLFEFQIIGFATFMILLSIWVITRKREPLVVGNLNGLSRKELEKIYYDLEKVELKILVAGSRHSASNIANIATIIFVVGLGISKYFIKEESIIDTK